MSSLDLCLKLLNDLDAHERNKVARRINVINKEAQLTVRDKACFEECSNLCDLVYNATGLMVLGKSREINTVSARRWVCKTLKDKGYSYPAIGRALKIDHSSVHFHCKKARDSEEYPRFYPEYHSIKKKINDYAEINKIIIV